MLIIAGVFYNLPAQPAEVAGDNIYRLAMANQGFACEGAVGGSCLLEGLTQKELCRLSIANNEYESGYWPAHPQHASKT